MEREITQKIALIISTSIEQIDIDTLDPNRDLQELGMDSLAFIRIIVGIEDEFEIEFPDDYLLISNMNTLNKFSDTVMLLLNEKS